MIPALLLLALQDPAPAPSARAAQRLELQRDVARTNGVWKLHEWGHYFVVTDVQAPEYLGELERRAFQARERCSRVFQLAESDPVRDDRRLPVLRAIRTEAEYHSYGAPAGSSGYWSSSTGEIVVYDDRDKPEAWEALVGCVAGAFVDEYFGNTPRADWFELGISEYCKAAIHEPVLRESDLAAWPTLEALLARPPRDWLSHLNDQPRPQLVAGSLMRFLLEAEPRWAAIPERYALGWLDHKDETIARAFAFDGVDLVALEKAWRASLCVTR